MSPSHSDLHQFQMLILNKIIFLPQARFRDLKIQGLTTDHLTYHLNTLVKKGILKKEDKIYKLTSKGKEYVSRMDTVQAKIESQGKRAVLIRTISKEKGKPLYLVNQRLKQPFYGYVGFHTGKIRIGETILQAAAREYKEETGLKGSFKFLGIIHFVDYKPDGRFLRDIYFYTFNVYKFSGPLIEENKEEGVSNKWMTKTQLKKSETYPGFWDDTPLSWIYMDKQKGWPKGKLCFLEKERVVTDY